MHCGHSCRCVCHRSKRNSIPCVICNCEKCYVCDFYVSSKYLQNHLSFCHSMATDQIDPTMFKRKPPLVPISIAA